MQAKTVIDRLDIFEKVGQNKALDYPFHNVVVKDGRLAVEFHPIIEFLPLPRLPWRVKPQTRHSLIPERSTAAAPPIKTMPPIYRPWALANRATCPSTILRRLGPGQFRKRSS